MEPLDKLAGALEQFYAQAQRAQDLADPATAQYLQSLVDQVRNNAGALTSEYRKASDGLQEQIAKSKEAAEDAKKKAAAAKEAHAAAQAAAKKPPAPPKPAPPPIDPRLAHQLRQELMHRFAPAKPGQASSNPELWNELKDWGT
jgi:hypothetical protein